MLKHFQDKILLLKQSILLNYKNNTNSINSKEDTTVAMHLPSRVWWWMKKGRGHATGWN